VFCRTNKQEFVVFTPNEICINLPSTIAMISAELRVGPSIDGELSCEQATVATSASDRSATNILFRFGKVVLLFKSSG
jgi:hypothetical protein